MPNAVTDTHALVWYLEDSPHLIPRASEYFNACDRGEVTIFIPVICLVELLHLEERGRIPTHLNESLRWALEERTSGLVVADFDRKTAEAVRLVPRSTVPEMPDWLIAATALRLGLPLLTQDEAIRNSLVSTIW